VDEAQALCVVTLPLHQLALQAAFQSVARYVRFAGRAGDRARRLGYDAMLALVVARKKLITDVHLVTIIALPLRPHV
jgi:hypothetical protein